MFYQFAFWNFHMVIKCFLRIYLTGIFKQYSTVISYICTHTDCTHNPCTHGTCTSSQQGYKCTCDAGYTGSICDRGKYYDYDMPTFYFFCFIWISFVSSISLCGMFEHVSVICKQFKYLLFCFILLLCYEKSSVYLLVWPLFQQWKLSCYDIDVLCIINN